MRFAAIGLLGLTLIVGIVPRTIGSEPTSDDVKRVLDEWQAHRPKSFCGSFVRWDYDFDLGTKENDYLSREASGEIEFGDRTHWTYRVNSLKKFDPSKQEFIDATDERENWTRTDDLVCESDYKTRTRTEWTIPKNQELNGLLARFVEFWWSGEWQLWMSDAKFIRDHAAVKVITPAKADGEYWLEITPTDEKTKATFEKLEIILDAHDFRTKAVQLYQPGGKKRMVFVFTPLEHLTKPGCDFIKWKHVVEP